LINKEKIAQMKKGVYLINTSRGGIVDTDALVWGLKEGIIGGAGLDVLEGEHELREKNTASIGAEMKKILELNKELINMENVIVTPHIAAQSTEAREEMARITAENINSFVSGSPENLVQN
jgi:D-lactate dehydrogenase